MWIIAAIIFVGLALHKLLIGSFFAFFVLVLFAIFAVYLNKAGFDLT
ncbi:MAG TPA: hypothetical protein VFX17_01930 [Patescibacteria group bacterium]|nr:hypothetical protein [Patescibacteria group bacterium]